MASTFFGLNIASSGLYTYQTALNTTGNNIANVQTEGYTRQEAVQKATEAIRTSQKYGTLGSGVETTEIRQIRNRYYDVKYWNNSTSLGEYSTKSYYMAQIEDYFEEVNKDGFTAAFDEMFNSLEEVSKNASDVSVRNQFINSAETLAEYFNSLSTGLGNIQKDCNEEIKNKVSQINTFAQEIASLNKQINVVELTGENANDLRDQRALLADRLSEIVPIEVKEGRMAESTPGVGETGATTYEITISGQSLVDTFEYNTLETVPRETRVNQSDMDGLYDIQWSNGLDYSMSGTGVGGGLKALTDIRDGNNADNFNGKIAAFGSAPAEDGQAGTVTTVRIEGTGFTDINKATLPGTGTIVLKNKEYAYSSFSYDSVSESYTFTLTETVDNASQAAMQGRDAKVGEAVDYLGIPYYMSQLNEFVRAFAGEFNKIHQTGQDLNGSQGGIFFTGEDALDSTREYGLTVQAGENETTYSSKDDSLYRLTAANFTVSAKLLEDPKLLASTTDLSQGINGNDVVEKLLKLKSDTVMFRGGYASEFLQSVLSDIAVDAQKADSFEANYSNISKSIVKQRLSVSGVDSDEEALNLVKYQNAYNLNAKMITVMSEIYDKLINETGV